MLFGTTRLFRRLAQTVRKSRPRGVLFVALLVLGSVLGNAVTFYYFDGAIDPDISFADSLWYSVISITTIGYGDYAAQTAAARWGTVVFIVLSGLTVFTTLLGMVVDWVIDFNYREKAGLMRVYAENHILIVNFPSAARVRAIIEELESDPKHRGKEIVIIADSIDGLPFEFRHVAFVKGSPIDREVFEYANVEKASAAVVLSPRYEDTASDSLVSATVTVIEELNPDIRTVAECLDERHEFLFRSTRTDAIIFPLRIANNLIVQETQDSGVSSYIDMLTSNRRGETVYSVRVSDADIPRMSYLAVAHKLLEDGVNLLSIMRRGETRTDYLSLDAQPADVLLYLAKKRKDPSYFDKVLREI